MSVVGVIEQSRTVEHRWREGRSEGRRRVAGRESVCVVGVAIEAVGHPIERFVGVWEWVEASDGRWEVGAG